MNIRICINYLLKNKWIFSAVLGVSSMMILPIMVSGDYSYFAFPGVAGVLFVAFSPNFRSDDLEDAVHTGSAIIALIFSQLWVGFINPISLVWWIPFLIYFIVQWFKNKTLSKVFGGTNIKFYAEIIMLLTVYTTLFLR